MFLEFMRVRFPAGKKHKKLHRNTAVLYLANLRVRFGGEEPQESTQEYSSPVFGKLAIDVADIPLPEGGKKKLNIPLTTPLGNVWK